MGFWGSSSSFDEAKSARCYRDYFTGKCASCTYFNVNDTLRQMFGSDKYKCLGGYSYQEWDSRICRKFELMDPSKRDYAEMYAKVTGRRYYFILTVICEVLGIDENHDLFQEIKALIQLVRSDNETLKEAVAYNAFGEEIADLLAIDPNRVEICKFLLVNYLSKVLILIKENKPEEAINEYKNMVSYLFVKYRNQENYANLINEDEIAPKKLVK